MDFLLRCKRDTAAVRRFLERAIALHGTPGKITRDKRAAIAVASLKLEVLSRKILAIRR